jgi:hypothetical protein
VFWANECDTAVALRVENFRARRMAVYTEKSLPADEGMIASSAIDADGITLPARSFGMLEE